MVEIPQAFELRCLKCGKVEELDTGTSGEMRATPIRTPIGRTHFCKTLEKLGILDAVNTVAVDGRTRITVLEPYLRIRSVRPGQKSINHVCFLHDYFEAVPEEAWPRKREILLKLSVPLKGVSLATRRRAKERFDRWWNSMRR